jgi:hypothetical protein
MFTVFDHNIHKFCCSDSTIINRRSSWWHLQFGSSIEYQVHFDYDYNNILKGGNRLDFTTEKDERLFHLLELTKRPIGTRQSILHVWASYLPNIRDNFIESRATYAKHSTSTKVLPNIHEPPESPASYRVWPDKKESYPKLFEFRSRILADLCFVGETNGGIGDAARNEWRLSQALTYWNRCSHQHTQPRSFHAILQSL